MEWLLELGRFHYDPRIKIEQQYTRFGEGALDPKSDRPVQLQSAALHQFGNFPAGNDTNAENSVGTTVVAAPACTLTGPS